MRFLTRKLNVRYFNEASAMEAYESMNEKNEHEKKLDKTAILNKYE